MAKRTQKSGTTARFGSRYGVSVRRRAGAALKKKSRHYTCPSCNYQKVRRCSHTFTGGVWEPFTRATDSNNRIIRRSMEGATATDMTVIAQQAALDYERNLSESEADDSEEE